MPVAHANSKGGHTSIATKTANQQRQITTYNYPPRPPAVFLRRTTITRLDFSKLNLRTAYTYDADANSGVPTRSGVKGILPCSFSLT